MNREETRQVLKVIKTSYPTSFSKMDADSANDFLDVWSDMFEHDDPMLVMSAVKSYIRSNQSQFAPAVGQITELMYKLSTPTSLSADEAWNMAYKAVCNSNGYANSEFKKLPPEVQAGVGSPDQLRTWALMDNQTVQSVIMAKFKKGYVDRVKEKKEFDLLPSETKQMIQNLTDSKRIQERED